MSKCTVTNQGYPQLGQHCLQHSGLPFTGTNLISWVLLGILLTAAGTAVWFATR